MTEDEERHADEVNIAFQMGAEWERKQSKARIEKLEAALHQWDHLIAHQFTGSRAAMSSMIEAAQITAALLHGEAPWPETRIEKLEAALRRIKHMHEDGGIDDIVERDDRTYFIVMNALEGKDD